MKIMQKNDNKLKVIKSKKDNRATLYSHDFIYENEYGVQLRVTAKFNMFVGYLMESLGDVTDSVELTRRYIDISKELFTVYDGEEKVNEHVSQSTWTDMFIVYMDNFAEEVQNVMAGKVSELSESTDATPSNQPRIY